MIVQVPSPAPGCTLPNALAQSACVAPRGPSPCGLGGCDCFAAVSLHLPFFFVCVCVCVCVCDEMLCSKGWRSVELLS